MLGAALFTVLPTFAAYLVLHRTRLVESELLKLAFAWFLGQCISTLVIFVVCVGLVGFTDGVLTKASMAYLLGLTIGGGLYLSRDTGVLASIAVRSNLETRGFLNPWAWVPILCLAFSFRLLSPHLSQTGNGVATSEIYWDFSAHFPLIQTFIYGDNFPPQNESFSGVPMTYHFFYYLLTAIYGAWGLGLVASINLVSGMTLAMMLIAIVGLAEELLGSWKVGVLAAVLSVTSGSLDFMDVLPNANWDLLWLLGNRSNPYAFALNPGIPFGYNGNMWNVFYWIAERHLVFGVIYLIFVVWILSVRGRLSIAGAVLLGAFMGLFFQWQSFLTISAFCAMGWVLLFGREDRRSTLALLLGFTPVVLAQSLYLMSLLNAQWFLPEIHDYPRLNFNFASPHDKYPVTLGSALAYYAYGYGLKVLLLPVGLYLLWRRKDPVLVVLGGILVPTFIVMNTVQLLPMSVYENHKWLRPMNVIVDLLVAFAVVRVFFLGTGTLRTVWERRLVGVAAIILITLSGTIELMPFLNARPPGVYALYPTPAIQAIRDNSPPRASFLSSEAVELHLAGRKLFVGNPEDETGTAPLIIAQKLNVESRRRISADVYASPDLGTFCALTVRNQIDFVDFSAVDQSRPIFRALSGFPQFSTEGKSNTRRVFVDARSGCTHRPTARTDALGKVKGYGWS